MDQTYSEPSGSESSEGQDELRQESQLSRKGAPWSEEEHYQFLEGLKKLGNWRGISRLYVPTRTPTQVASHAQKHFLRVSSSTVRRKSRFTKIEEQVLGSAAHNNVNHSHAVPNRMPPSNTGRSMGLGVVHNSHGSSAAAGMSHVGMKRASYGTTVMGAPATGAPMPSTSGSSASEGAALMSGMPGVANGVPCMPPPAHLAAMFPFGNPYAAALAAAAAYGALPFGFPPPPGSETNTPGATAMTQGSSVFPAPSMEAVAAAAQQAQQPASQVAPQADNAAALSALGVPVAPGPPAVQPQAATLMQAAASAPQAASVQPTPSLPTVPSAADLAAGNGLLALLAAAASGLVKPEASPVVPSLPAPAPAPAAPVSAPASAALAAAMLQHSAAPPSVTAAASAAFQNALMSQISSAAAVHSAVPGAPAPLSMPLPSAPYQSYPLSMYTGHSLGMPQSSFFSAGSVSAAPLLAQYAQYRSLTAQPPVSAPPCEVRMC